MSRRTLQSFGTILSLCALVVSGCQSGGTGGPGTSPNGNGSGGGPRVTGRVGSPSPAARTILEREPNDWSDGSQLVGRTTPAVTYRIVGGIHAGPPANDVDTYRFIAAEPVSVSWQLTSAEPEAGSDFDLDLGFIDFRRFHCGLDWAASEVFAECYTDVLTENTGGTFLADGTFELCVVPVIGRGSYTLDISVSAAGSATEAHASGVIPGTSGRPRQVKRRAYAPPQGDVVPGETLATFDPALSAEDVAALVRRQGLRIVEQSPSGVYRLAGDVVEPPKSDQTRLRTCGQAANLAANAGVRFAEPNRILGASATPNDQFYNRLRYPEMIGLPTAWDITTGSPDVVIAVLDTGILHEHPDLGGRLIEGYDFISDVGNALDGDGRDDDPSDPGDAVDDRHASTYHGTHTTGTLAAMTNNVLGISGVTWDCRVMPIRVLGRASIGDILDISEAIRYAAGLSNISGALPVRRADVVNLSLDGGAGHTPSATMAAAIRDAAAAGVVLVAASGNQGSSAPAYPAGYAEVISVGAVDWSGELTPYSNYGATLDLVAPGGSDVPGEAGEPAGLLSTVGADNTGTLTYEYGYRYGTSMACPQVAGVAALMFSVNPALSAAQIRQILRDTATDLGLPGRDDSFGYGLVDAARAVDAARITTGLGMAPPRLTLSTHVLDFGDETTILSVDITNAGGGTLVIENVAVREQVGSAWLDATPGGGSASATCTTIAAVVDRRGLAPGQYRGSIEITPFGGGPAVVEVFAHVPGADGPPDTMHVVVRDAATGAMLARREVDPDGSFLLSLPPVDGPVVLWAGTDRDGDGVICESQDACGAWPGIGSPRAVDQGLLDLLDTFAIPVLEPDPRTPWPF
ncbi:MAG: S8 family serine peptidase [Phycisphaerae bacterium]|nr:S8 family serine peptidase [Phycisphaerae bacterium]